ncbi:MAG: acetate uptake transporter [Bacteroidales bacterium]
MTGKQTVLLADTTTNPAPLGLTGFGLTTLLLNLHNIGLFPLDSMIMAMGLFVGGALQVIAGKLEWKKNNMFGMLAFSAYGFFWISLIVLMILPKLGWGEAPSAIAMGWFLTVWALFTFGMVVASFALSKIMRVLFITVLILFALLAAADFTGSSTLKILGGIDGVICGTLALFVALATVINDTYKRVIIPLN